MANEQTEQTKPTTIDVGEIDNAIELVFAADRDDARYVLQPAGAADDYLALLQRFAQFQVKRTTHFYIDDTAGQWFACYNVDCFDPPMAIVRARSFESAYEVFIDEFGDWMAVSDSDAADYPEDDRQYNASGKHVDTDNVQIHPLTLIGITCAAPTKGGN